MGQNNESENPELILEKLKSMTIKDENNTSLDKSFNTIRNILKDYKFYKNLLEQNKNNNRKTISYFNIKKYNSSHEFSKDELINLNGNYGKNVIQDINHKIERIKKWVKMVKSPYDNNDKSFSKNENESFENIENNLNIIDNKDKINKFKSSNNVRKAKQNNIVLSNYTDKKIENGIIIFSQNQNNKYIERIKKGPPDCFRWVSWCVIHNLPLDRDNYIYENYINMSLEKENKDRIIRDIERTFSEKNIEKVELRKMETSLYKVLKAFWNLDKEVGYCQGMNLLVGFLLILSEFNERDTFYLLVGNFSDTFKLRRKYEYNFRGLFYEEFPLLYFLNYIFNALFEQYINDLKNHLENLGISIDLWMGKWFQTVFTIILPINWCKRLWDNIFAENIFFMVKFGIAFTMLIKDDLMKMDEEVDILNYFKDFEKYSLCSDNDILNQKSDVYSIIIKSKKIKLDVDYFLKNYEKNEENGKNFINKMEKIEDIKYEFYEQFISKPTLQTILFSDDEKLNANNNINNNKINNNEQKEEIIFEEKNNEIENENNKNNNEKIRLRNKFPKRNTAENKNNLKNNIFPNDISNQNKKYFTDGKGINKFSSDEPEEIGNNSSRNNNNFISINNDNEVNEDSINNTYYQNVNENFYFDNNNINNIIENHLGSHQFDHYLKKNRLDDLYKNNQCLNKKYTKDSNDFSPSKNGKNENIGIHIPQEDDISFFIGKNKFNHFQKKKKQDSNFNNEYNKNSFLENFRIIFDKEKINQWC